MRTYRALAFAAGCLVLGGGCSTDPAHQQEDAGTGGTDGAAGDAACVPRCGGKLCGDGDGCGGRCVRCPSTSQVCNAASWQCQSTGPCDPDCSGKGCGDADGCGGICTACAGEQVCDVATGLCQDCAPSCSGKYCGDEDGCGGACTACADSAQLCDLQTGTCRPACTPDCTSSACGADDGCGGVCTVCPTSGQVCNTLTLKCEDCTKQCGPQGTCVLGWEDGPHCQCAPGYHDTYGGCEPSAGTACDGVTCNGHGTCFTGPPFFGAECRCEGDYVRYGSTCSPRNKLRCIDRDGSLKDRGTIRCSADDTVFEVCRDGDGDGVIEWVASGAPSCPSGATCSACLGYKCDAGDGTGGQPCPTGTICMSKVHEMDVYICVVACDCSNCGTCDPEDFTGWQRACGSEADSFDGATVVCNSPCPSASDGCLPYGAYSFCFGMEGCASAAPQ